MMGVATGLALAGLATAGFSFFGTKKAAGAAAKASGVQGAADAAAIAFEKEQAAQKQKEYDEERARTWMQEDEDRKIAATELALKNRLTAEDRARRLQLSRPYTDLGTASADTIRKLMTGETKAPSYYAPLAPPPPVPSGPISRLPSHPAAFAPVPSMTPNMMPVTVPPDAATLAELARRR